LGLACFYQRLLASNPLPNNIVFYSLSMRSFAFSIAISLMGFLALSSTLPLHHNPVLPVWGLYNSASLRQFFPIEAPLVRIPTATPTAQDSAATAFKISLFNFASYDSIYPLQMKRFLQRELPGATFSEFWEGTSASLEQQLTQHQAVVLSYPSIGDPALLAAYGKKLRTFVRQGGLVVITGTHAATTLKQTGLLDADYAQYFETASIHLKKEQHRAFLGVQGDFPIRKNYTYPLEINDAGFVVLAETQGMPVIGYKELGEGKIVYLGFEYYEDEDSPSQILGNIFEWSLTPTPNPTNIGETPRTAAIKRNEEFLFSGAERKVDLKIYPNPYVEKAALEFELEKNNQVSVEMADELGTSTILLLPQRNLTPGNYRIELPDLAPGIYFVKCKIGGQIEVRKVVKQSRQ
jgi:hypothetical protein